MIKVTVKTDMGYIYMDNPTDVWVTHSYMFGLGVYGYCLYYSDDTYQYKLIYWRSDTPRDRSAVCKDAQAILDGIDEGLKAGKDKIFIDIT